MKFRAIFQSNVVEKNDMSGRLCVIVFSDQNKRKVEIERGERDAKSAKERRGSTYPHTLTHFHIHSHTLTYPHITSHTFTTLTHITHRISLANNVQAVQVTKIKSL